MKTGLQKAIRIIDEKPGNPLVNFLKTSAPDPVEVFFVPT